MVDSWKDFVPGSVVFYDSLRRLPRDLAYIEQVFPQASVAIGRELTKMFEEIKVLPVADGVSWLETQATLKGEVTVQLYLPEMVPDAAELRQTLLEQAKQRFAAGARLKDLLGEWRDRGLSRSELYQMLLEAKDSGHPDGIE